MKKRRWLKRMLLGGEKVREATLGEVSDLDADYGVAGVSLSDVLGGFSPARLYVGGAPLAGQIPSLDMPIELPSAGEHAVDRIGRGFFKYQAENISVISYDTNGLGSASEGIVTLALGAPFSGSVTLSVKTESRTREISGGLGDCFDFSVSGEVLLHGSLSFRASGDGVFRLSLHGKEETGEGLALTLLAATEKENLPSFTRISLPTPMYFLPNGKENGIELSHRTLRKAVSSVPITLSTPASVKAGSENSGSPVFLLSLFPDGRGEGAALSTHGAVPIDNSDVTVGLTEGFSLLSDESETLALSIKFQRLALGMGSVLGERRDSFTSASPDAVAAYDFYPRGDGVLYTVSGEGGERLSLRLSEPLRRVGEISDTLLVSPKHRIALRITRIGRLTLSGNESIQMQSSGGGIRFFCPYLGGQMSNVSNTVAQLCTHADVSAAVALLNPGQTDAMTAYLDRTGLYVAMARDREFSTSRSALIAYLRAEAARGAPFTLYYPLADARIEPILLSPVSGGGESLATSSVIKRDGDTLVGLLRLWILCQNVIPRVLYPLPSPRLYTISETDGRLRLPSGRVTVSAVGRYKPSSLAIAALVEPPEKGTSSALAAEDEE